MSTQNEKLPTAVEFIHRLAYAGKIKGFEAASWDEIQEKFQPDVKPTPAPSAPAAMSRDKMILQGAIGMYYDEGNTCPWSSFNDEASKETYRKRAEACLDRVGVLPPAPPPPPQKSVNEQVAEGMVKRSDGGDVLCTHPTDKDRALLLRHISLSSENTVISLREYIAAALDARDAEHRAALEPLLKLIDQPYRDTYSQYEPYIREIREQASKLAERIAAK